MVTGSEWRRSICANYIRSSQLFCEPLLTLRAWLDEGTWSGFLLCAYVDPPLLKQWCRLSSKKNLPGWERSPGEGNGNPHQYSCLENPMERGAWPATVHGVARVRHNLVTKPPPPPPHWGIRKFTAQNDFPEGTIVLECSLCVPLSYFLAQGFYVRLL